MKKKIGLLLLAGLLLLTASGCGSVFEAEYSYEEPVTGDFGTISGNATEIRNYSMLKTALTDMISRREEQGEFRFSSYNGSPNEDLAAACFEIKSANPLGAFAVETLSYDTNYVVSYYTANIYISYKRTAEEIESIVYARTQTEFDGYVLKTVDEFGPEALVRLYSSIADEDYIRRLVRQHYYDNLQTMVLEPAVAVESFPEGGNNRIYRIHFGYALTGQRTEAMAGELADILNGAVETMTETEPLRLALENAEWLSGHCAANGKSAYANTAYGALVDRAADTKGMALAYAALCRCQDIPCIVVEGSIGTMGTAHFWNIIELDGEYYHVDVSAFAEQPENAFLLSDDALWGTHIWNTEDYPACRGSYTYADAAGLHITEQEENAAPEAGQAEETSPESRPEAQPANAPAAGQRPGTADAE